MPKKLLHRPLLTETINNGHFGKIAKGWPYETMYDEGATSSVFGQDLYRLDIGPEDLVNREKIENSFINLGIVSFKEFSEDSCSGDLADQWLKEH